MFVQAINSSDLCIYSKFKSLDHALVLYDTVLNSLLNTHAPLRTKRVKTGAAKWWNSKCQQAHRERQQAEQKHKHLKTKESKVVLKDKSKSAAEIIAYVRDTYFKTKLSNAACNPKKYMEL